jgi:hypothetical protein
MVCFRLYDRRFIHSNWLIPFKFTITNLLLQKDWAVLDFLIVILLLEIGCCVLDFLNVILLLEIELKVFDLPVFFCCPKLTFCFKFPECHFIAWNVMVRFRLHGFHFGSWSWIFHFQLPDRHLLIEFKWPLLNLVIYTLSLIIKFHALDFLIVFLLLIIECLF